MRSVKLEVEEFDPQQVLDVLRASGRPMAWSSIVMAIRGVRSNRVKIEQVRGVRNACLALEAEGLVEETSTAVFRAV